MSIILGDVTEMYKFLRILVEGEEFLTRKYFGYKLGKEKERAWRKEIQQG